MRRTKGEEGYRRETGCGEEDVVKGSIGMIRAGRKHGGEGVGLGRGFQEISETTIHLGRAAEGKTGRTDNSVAVRIIRSTFRTNIFYKVG